MIATHKFDTLLRFLQEQSLIESYDIGEFDIEVRIKNRLPLVLHYNDKIETTMPKLITGLSSELKAEESEDGLRVYHDLTFRYETLQACSLSDLAFRTTIEEYAELGKQFIEAFAEANTAKRLREKE